VQEQAKLIYGNRIQHWLLMGCEDGLEVTQGLSVVIDMFDVFMGLVAAGCIYVSEIIKLYI